MTGTPEAPVPQTCAFFMFDFYTIFHRRPAASFSAFFSASSFVPLKLTSCPFEYWIIHSSSFSFASSIGFSLSLILACDTIVSENLSPIFYFALYAPSSIQGISFFHPA